MQKLKENLEDFKIKFLSYEVISMTDRKTDKTMYRNTH